MKAGKTTRTGQKRNRARPAGQGAQAKTAGARAMNAVVIPFSPPAVDAEAGEPARLVAPAAAVMFDADCTARHSDQLKAVLLARVDVPEPVSLDITAIERIDTVALQLLTAFVRDRLRNGLQIVWAGHNDVFIQAVRLLGLTAALDAAAVA